MYLTFNLCTSTLDVYDAQDECIGHLMRIVPNPHKYLFAPKPDVVISAEELKEIIEILDKENANM